MSCVRIGRMEDILCMGLYVFFVLISSSSRPISTKFGTWVLKQYCWFEVIFAEIGAVDTALYLICYTGFCPYSLHFMADFDKIQHRWSTSNCVKRTSVVLESVQWKPYFAYESLRFFGLIPSFMLDLNKIRHVRSTTNSVERTWVSLTSVEWKPYLTTDL